MNGYTLTYAQLFTEVMEIVDSDNDEFVAQLPAIIQRGHDAVRRDLGLAIWRTFKNHHTSFNSAIIDRDPSWLQVFSIFLPTVPRHLDQRHMHYVRMYGGTGIPKVWAEVNDKQIMLAPIPNMNFTMQVEVLEKEPFNAENPESWISRNAADLLLLASLIGAEIFLHGGARTEQFAALYSSLLETARREMRDSERSRLSPIREAPRPNVTVGANA